MSGDLESVLRVVALLVVFVAATAIGVLNARRHDHHAPIERSVKPG